VKELRGITALFVRDLNSSGEGEADTTKARGSRQATPILQTDYVARLAAVAGPELMVIAPLTPVGKNPPLVAPSLPPYAR
jgi:hypothetical protein